MMGILRADEDMNPRWENEIEAIKREAVPVIAMRHQPLPAVLLDIEKQDAISDVFRILPADGGKLEHWVVWCSLLTPDLSTAESFLLVNITAPISTRFILRFHLLHHHEILETIARMGNLALFMDQQTELAVLSINAPELQEHLALFAQCQHEHVSG